MKDIDIAKKLLQEEQLKLAIVKDGKIIFKSNDRGIKPIFTAVKDMKEELYGSSVADKVTGKAAAMLCDYSGIKELSTKLISDNAIRVLENTKIVYEYEESVPYIKNRDGTGMCPVESLSVEAHDISELLQEITKFLDNLKRG